MTLPLRLRINQVCAELGFSRSTFYRRWKSYGLSIVKDGGCSCVRLCDLETYNRLTSQESPSRPAR